MNREIKFEIMFWKHDRNFNRTVGKHYTTLDLLTSGGDPFKYNDVDIIAKRQYTGLKDKSGTEIYEGDILKTNIDFGYGPQPVVAKVIWKDAGWQFDSKAGCAYGASFAFEIIGNIYQNPELLKESK